MPDDPKNDGKINVSIGGNATGNAIGNQASVRANTISGGNTTQQDELSRLFNKIFISISERSSDPTVDKEEITEVVQQLQEEATKGDKLDESIIRRRLRAIARMAPDILDVVIETFKNPVLGVATVIRNIAQKMKEEAQG